MLVVNQILADGHEDLSPAALLYMQSMAERHGFTVVDEEAPCEGRPVRIRIEYALLKDPYFMALVEPAVRLEEPD